jgi:hypothetical protein
MFDLKENREERIDGTLFSLFSLLFSLLPPYPPQCPRSSACHYSNGSRTRIADRGNRWRKSDKCVGLLRNRNEWGGLWSRRFGL